MAANDVVDVAGAQAGVVMLRGEVAAPDDAQLWMASLQLSTKRDSVTQLRARHDRDAEHGRAAFAHQPIYGPQRLRVEIAVHDDVLVPALEQRPEREQRQRHDRLAPRRAGRVVEN